MELDLSSHDLSTPFALLRQLVARLDGYCSRDWQHHMLTRAVFHRSGRSDESLSEQQGPRDQLRYYTAARVTRGLTYVAHDYAERLPERVTITLNCLPTQPDQAFVDVLVASGDARLRIVRQVHGPNLEVDQPAQEYMDHLAMVRNHTLAPAELSSYLSTLLSYGDSWTAKRIAEEYLRTAGDVLPALADVLGIPFALHGETGMAKLLWEVWAQESPISEARARYSLSMLDARHHPRALLSGTRARAHLERAWSVLKGIPDSEDVNYEKVFNRNGIALIMFREQEFGEAREVLETGIASLEQSRYAKQLHQTVLTSNLARVLHSMGEDAEAERMFRLAVDMDPKFAEYRQDLASFLCDKGEFQSADREINTAIQLDPSMPEAHRLKGFVKMQLGMPMLARDAYSESAALGDADALVDMLRASFEAGTSAWTLANRARVDRKKLDATQIAECELLIAQAEIDTDPSIDVVNVLARLRAEFPNDELIEQTYLMNADR